MSKLDNALHIAGAVLDFLVMVFSFGMKKRQERQERKRPKDILPKPNSATSRQNRLPAEK